MSNSNSSALSAIVSGGSGLLGTLGSMWSTNKVNNANRDLNRENIQANKDMLKSEQDFSEYMMRNQKQMQMDDAKMSGINPAFASGSLVGANAASNPTNSIGGLIPSQGYDMTGIANGIQKAMDYLLQKKQVDADSRLKNADAEHQELLNEDKKALNNALNDSYTITQVDPKTGKVIPDNKVDEWSVTHPDELPELVSVKDTRFNSGAQGRFEGEKMKREWKSRLNALDTEDWKNALDMSVHKLQMNDKGIMEALSQMPRKQFDELCEIVTSLANENSVWDKKKDLLQIDLDMAKLQKRISENSNLYEYIEKMFDGDFTWKDFGKMVAMTLVGLVQNLGGIGVGVSNLRSLVSSKPDKIGFR